MTQYLVLMIFVLMQGQPNSIFVKSPEARWELALEIESASGEFDVSPYDMVIWSFRESTFKHNAKDHQNSYGVGQIQGVLREACESEGIDLKTRKNQYRCMAKSIRDEINRCDSYHKGLFAYTSGRCEWKGRPKWVVMSREKQKMEVMRRVDDSLQHKK